MKAMLAGAAGGALALLGRQQQSLAAYRRAMLLELVSIQWQHQAKLWRLHQ